MNTVIALVRPKNIMVYARGKPRVRQHYEYRWFWSDWMIAHTPIKGWIKTIGPLTDHEVQSMKISTFFNTHIQRISLWNELSQVSFYLPTLQVVAWLNKLAQGYPTQILGERVVYKINQLDHELNITVRWQLGDTFEKIFGKSRTTDMLLSSRTISLFRARWYDQ